MKKNIQIISFLSLATVFMTGTSFAQHLDAYTIPMPGVYVYLTWGPDSGSSTQYSYNIYRKLASDASFPSSPLNSVPITPITNCANFKTVIPSGSADWNMLANVYADSATHAPLSNVCDVTSYAYGSRKWQTLMLFARARKSVGIASGYGYQDNSAVNGTSYIYRIRRVSGSSELPS